MNCVICGKPILPGQTYMAPPPADAPWHSPTCPQTEQTGDITYDAILAAYMEPFVAVEEFISSAVTPYPANATRLSAWAAEEKAEQKKTVEQSYPEAQPTLHTNPALPVGDKQESDIPVTPAAGGPDVANVGGHRPGLWAGH
jgi:hypothetical protein